MRYSCILSIWCVACIGQALAAFAAVVPTARVGGDAASWSPVSHDRRIGEDPASWSPVSHDRRIGEDPASWSPVSHDRRIGDDPASWSPVSHDRRIGEDPASWSPSVKNETYSNHDSQGGREMGKDSSTWAPKKRAHLIGQDPSTWTPRPATGENATAACSPQQDAVDLSRLTELQNLLKHELDLQCEASTKKELTAERAGEKNGTVAPLPACSVPSGPKSQTYQSCSKYRLPSPPTPSPSDGFGCGKTRHFAHECYLAEQKKHAKPGVCRYTNKLAPPRVEQFDDDILERCDPSGFPGKHFYHGRWIWSLDKSCWVWEQGKWVMGRDQKCQFVRGKWGFISDDDAAVLSSAFPKGLGSKEPATGQEPLLSLHRADSKG